MIYVLHKVTNSTKNGKEKYKNKKLGKIEDIILEIAKYWKKID